MRPSLVLVPAATLLAGVLVGAGAVGQDGGAPRLEDVLRVTGDWVARFAEESAFVVANERYQQEYRPGDRSPDGVQRRTLLSEIVFVRTPEEEARAGYPWVQFRDVIEVDGVPLADHRGRLERLFEQAGPSAYAQASAMIRESAQYNIGPGIRTVNVPCFALFFLHPRNQSRFRFELLADQVLRYRERARPTMILSPRHQDLPATGLFWIDRGTGRVLRTRMDVAADKAWSTTTEVTYLFDAGVDAWVPQTMNEHASGRGAERLDCTATYSDFRRFRADARIIR